MSSENTERRCKSCNKLLLDEKLPFCPRCMLEGRNKAVQIGEIIVGLCTAKDTGLAIINFSDHTMDESSDDETV